MRYICDICLYECICHDGMQKKNICRFGSLCRVLHSAKDPFAERNGHNARQSWQNGRPENRFPSFTECCDSNTRQRIFFKKNLNFAECLPCWHSAKSFKKKSLPSAWSGGTRQRKFPKKNKSSLPSAFRVDARQRIFQKKIKNICRVPGGLALGKENFQKK